jgi:tetratricopeptide (TPR) repeat protein
MAHRHLGKHSPATEGSLHVPTRCFAIALALLLAAGCGPTESSRADSVPPENRIMEEGLRALYQGQDPVAADSLFQRVLATSPTHYGARYQRAVALDMSGKPTEARAIWTEVLTQAQSYNDTGSVRIIRARLAAPDTASQGGLMVRGLDLMYKRNDPAAAAEQFRAILQRNATHYGATYQLATALDRLNRRAEARPLWQRVTGMATSYKDSATLATARARLATP